jgi:hypothetical protein
MNYIVIAIPRREVATLCKQWSNIKMYVVIVIPGRASATPCKQGNKQLIGFLLHHGRRTAAGKCM